MENQELSLIPHKEGIKLIRGAKGDYRWELKTFLDSDDKTDVDRLVKLDKLLREKFIENEAQ
jgi:hypothetical protein